MVYSALSRKQLEPVSQSTPNNPLNQPVLNNLFWFFASLILAFVIWVIAINAADPVEERRLSQQIPIQILLADGMIITEQQTTNARVTVRAPESVFPLLSPEDVIVEADLSELGAGTYTVELVADVARRAQVVDTIPRQITVSIEPVQSQQVPVSLTISAPPPAGYEVGEPTFGASQVTISGPASLVNQVTSAQGSVDLSDQRSTLDNNIRLTPVDAEGEAIENLMIDPPIITMTLPITLPENVRPVTVRPDVDTDSIPDGYELVSITQDLQTVIVSGTNIPEVLETETISLENRTTDFEITVPILLPNRRLFILGDQQDVTVEISILPRLRTRTFEEVPVRTVGLDPMFEVEIIPTAVTLIITGPEAEIDSISERDLRVVLDLNGLEPGVYDRAPIAFNGDVQIQADNISITPPTINLTIINPAEITETPPGTGG